MPAEAIRQPWWRQFLLLTRVQYSEYRDSMAFLVLGSLAMPLGLLWLAGPHLAGTGLQAAWFLAGNATMSMAFGSGRFAIFRIGQLRLDRELDYYATLPVSRSAFVATLFTMSQISSLPGLIGSLVAGHLILQVPLPLMAAGIPVLLLASFCVMVVGTAAGALARSWGQVNNIGNLVNLLVIFFTPVILPFERLPLPLQITSLLLPTGQATLALTEAFSGRFGLRFWLMTGLLLLWTVAAVGLSLRRLDWRND